MALAREGKREIDTMAASVLLQATCFQLVGHNSIAVPLPEAYLAIVGRNVS